MSSGMGRAVLSLACTSIAIILLAGMSCRSAEVENLPQETSSQADAAGTPSDEMPSPISKHIVPGEAYSLIEENHDNPDFVIIDTRSPIDFADRHIDNSINIDFSTDTLEEELGTLDKNKTYLIYCPSGCASGHTLNIMRELGFREIYNLWGGINQWIAEGFPVTEVAGNITPEEAFALIKENENNDGLIIIDTRNQAEFTDRHIDNAINIDFYSEGIMDELGKLDNNKTYILYDLSRYGGGYRLDVMRQAGFQEVYNISTGINGWIAEGLPTVSDRTIE
jgi:rhodanese-related sulfurtransferase